MTKEIVVVFINGFLIPKDWISYPKHLKPNNIRMIDVYPSSTGSLHDRVCQIFYELVGGKVDYGEEHAEFHGHSRFGKTYEKGLFTNWNRENPIIVVGHSFGGITGWVLQNYLAEGKFPGYNTDASWVKAVIGVNAPFNGTLRVYPLGMSEHQPPIVYWGTPGYLLSLAIQTTEYLKIKNLMDMDQGENVIKKTLHHSDN